MSNSNLYFWDSCCFIAYLNDEQEAYDVTILEQYLDDAETGKAQIITSTLTLAEVRPRFMKRGHGSFNEFLDDFSGSITLVDPSPDIMIYAGRLRDLPYKKSNSTKRQLATPDAIMVSAKITASAQC